MSNNPMVDILNQKAQNVAKAKNAKQVKFNSAELNLSLQGLRAQYPNMDAATEKMWLEQKAIANPTDQNTSFLEDAGTDLSIAFGSDFRKQRELLPV